MSEVVEKVEKTSEPKIEVTVEECDIVTKCFSEDRMRFLNKMPFYGILLLDLDPVASGLEIPTAAVNYRNLYLHALSNERRPKNPDDESIPTGYNYANLSEVGRQTILAHEILHLVFDHLSIPTGFNRDIANIAMDSVINRILSRDSSFNLAELPEGCVSPIRHSNSDDYSGFTIGPGVKKKAFVIADFDKKDWIPIYWDIYKQLEKENGAGSREKTAEAINKAAKEIAGSNPMQGDVKDGVDPDGNNPDFEQQKARFKQKVTNAVEQAKRQGNLPAEFERLIEDLDEGKVHWTQYLRNLIKPEIARDDFSNKYNSRRAHLFPGDNRRPPVFPKVESEALGDVFLALDTSGSMSEKDIREGLSEFASLRQVVPFNLHFVSCDARAYEVTSYSKDEEPRWTDMPISGGGGTDFRPVFQLIEKYKEEKGIKLSLLVYFTDSYGTFPDKAPNYPVIWVLNIKDAKVPWGTPVFTCD